MSKLPFVYEAWQPHFNEALKGFYEIQGRIGRHKIIANNHGYFAMQNTCRLALGFEHAEQTIGEHIEQPPQLEVDQIADYALGKGLEVFDRIQARTEFFQVMVSGGMLEDGVALNG